jgi:glycosyltransferase involved in cell wall biosynthesis
MKVLHIIDSLALGGAQSLLQGIVEAQSSNQDLHCYCLRQTPNSLQIDHTQVLSCQSTWRFSLAPLFELSKLIRDKEIEVLHCHLLRSQVFGWLLKKFRFRKCKLVFHEHGRIFGTEDGNIVIDRLYKWFLVIAQEGIFRIIAVSQAVERRLDSLRLKTTVRVLYNFIDLERFSRGSVTSTDSTIKELQSRIVKEEFVIGFAGRLIERKGWQDFLTAVSEMIQDSSRVQVLIAGSGPDEKKILQRIQGLQHIHYGGQIKDMRSFYQLLDCFVIPSHWEPMGLTHLEAAACGVAVIAANTEGLNETIINERNGLLFEAGNSADLSQKISRMRDDAVLRRRLAEQGLEDVKAYSRDLYLERLEMEYKSDV